MMTTARDHLSRSDAVTVARIEAAVPDLAAAYALTGRFANMVRNGEHDNLIEWLSEAGRRGIEQNPLTLPSPQGEGLVRVLLGGCADVLSLRSRAEFYSAAARTFFGWTL